MKEKLLILDDESLILTSLEHLFEDDYEVFTTTNAETALRLAMEHDMAVILCDERMPGVSGHEFLRRVREVSKATRVMMSGYADMSALTEAVNSAQIFAYIAKPWKPLKLKGKVGAAAVHFKLESDLRHTNAELKERNIQVEQASKMKSAFLANMSHELRTPLNGIIGFTELMVDGVTGPVSAAQKECLNDVLSSARHLLALINDVLDVAKVESGTLVFKPERIVISDVVMDAVSGLRPLALQKKIHLDVDVDHGALAAVWIDPQKLKQVLLNYLSNALKFTPSHGSITVRVRPENKLGFRLEVEDSGIGISKPDIQRLFQEFQQLDGGYSKQFQGTGLGLALTKRLVEAQGGQVGVESTVGIGSKFFAVFPSGVEQPAEPELAPSMAS